MGNNARLKGNSQGKQENVALKKPFWTFYLIKNNVQCIGDEPIQPLALGTFQISEEQVVDSKAFQFKSGQSSKSGNMLCTPHFCETWDELKPVFANLGNRQENLVKFGAHMLFVHRKMQLKQKEKNQDLPYMNNGCLILQYNELNIIHFKFLCIIPLVLSPFQMNPYNTHINPKKC